MLIAFGIFLLVTLHVWAFLLYRWKADDVALKNYDRWVEEDLAEVEERDGWVWGYLKSANARRKRFERALRRERTRAKLVERNMIIRHGQVLGELEKAHEELDQLEERYKQLAAQAVEGLLAHEEKQIMSLYHKESQ
jgi:hypothetical protein